MQLCLMPIVIDFIRLADVPSPIDLVSSSRIFAAKHNELTSSYSLVMLILIFMLAYANCVTSFPKGWKVIVGLAYWIVANSFSSLAFVIQINRRFLFFGKEKNPFSPKLAHTMHVLAILNTKYYICLSAYTVTIMIKPREKHLPKFTKGISNSATRKVLLAKRIKRIYC